MSTAIHVIVRYTIKDGQHDRYEARAGLPRTTTAYSAVQGFTR